MGRRKREQRARERSQRMRRCWRLALLILAILVFALIVLSNGEQVLKQDEAKSHVELVSVPALPVSAEPSADAIKGDLSEDDQRTLYSIFVLLDEVEFAPADRKIAARLKQTSFAYFHMPRQRDFYALADLRTRSQIHLTPQGISPAKFWLFAVALMHEGDHLLLAPPGVLGLEETNDADVLVVLREECRAHANDPGRIAQLEHWIERAPASAGEKDRWLSELDCVKRFAAFSRAYYAMRLAHRDIWERLARALTTDSMAGEESLRKLRAALDCGRPLRENRGAGCWVSSSGLLQLYAQRALETTVLLDEADREAVEKMAKWILANIDAFIEAHQTLPSNI
ncbi:MAG TPA: hypothetical protein PLP17_02420 [Oligoflexia bacterium]|nr:hypothetical protein [Oligoflexia bacterium]